MNATIPQRLWQPAVCRLACAGVKAASSSSTLASTASAGLFRRSPTTSAPLACRQCLRGWSSLSRRATHKPAAGSSSFSTTAARRRPRPPPGEPVQPADDPNFTSILDNPPELVRSGRRHGPGIIVLALIPIAAFALGTWQVFRLRWKTDLLAKCEDRIVRSPFPLDPENVAAAVAHSRGETAGNGASDFDYRRIVAYGTFRHDQEMLVGPRIREGAAGYLVITPFEIVSRDGKETATILVNRGWISREQRSQRSRARYAGALPRGLVRVEGMLRAPWKRNLFTPENRPDKGEFYFPDVNEMAALTNSLPVWVEATMEPDLLQVYDMELKGIPLGKPAEVNLRNNHAQYIFTWYSLSLATSIMLWMVAKKPQADITKRVRLSKNW